MADLTTPPDELQRQAKIQELRAQGVPDEMIAKLIAADPSETSISDQYKMSAILRNKALGGDAKNAYGAAAQGIMGYMAGKEQAEYKDSMAKLLASRQGKNTTAMEAWKLGRKKPWEDELGGYGSHAQNLGYAPGAYSGE